MGAVESAGSNSGRLAQRADGGTVSTWLARRTPPLQLHKSLSLSCKGGARGCDACAAAQRRASARCRWTAARDRCVPPPPRSAPPAARHAPLPAVIAELTGPLVPAAVAVPSAAAGWLLSRPASGRPPGPPLTQIRDAREADGGIIAGDSAGHEQGQSSHADQREAARHLQK